MASIAAAARAIAWTSDDAWRRVRSSLRGPLGRVGKRDRALGAGVVLRDGEVHIAADVDPADDALLALRAGAMRRPSIATVIDRGSLERLADARRRSAIRGRPTRAISSSGCFGAGADAIPVIEALDHRGIWTRILPEWEPVRVASATELVPPLHRRSAPPRDRRQRGGAAPDGSTVPTSWCMSALMHDLGKGVGGDHTEVGVEIARRLGARLGFPEADVDVLAELVANHLLLSEVALRRDLDDPATIQRVAERVSSLEALRLLAVLTEADSRATGPAAWGPAKAQLVALLVARVAKLMGDTDVEEMEVPEFPSETHRALLASEGNRIVTGDELLSVATSDRPGIFSKVAGVLAFHGLDVVSASAYSADGRALSEFGVSDPFRAETPWPRIEQDLELALDGRLAVHARVAERARRYAKPDHGEWRAPITTVRFDNDASDTATVIDVHAVDGVGVLYRITRALTEFNVDIRSARVADARCASGRRVLRRRRPGQQDHRRGHRGRDRTRHHPRAQHRVTRSA